LFEDLQRTGITTAYNFQVSGDNLGIGVQILKSGLQSLDLNHFIRIYALQN